MKPPYRTSRALLDELEALLLRAHDVLDELRRRFGLDADAPPPTSESTADDRGTDG